MEYKGILFSADYMQNLHILKPLLSCIIKSYQTIVLSLFGIGLIFIHQSLSSLSWLNLEVSLEAAAKLLRAECEDMYRQTCLFHLDMWTRE